MYQFIHMEVYARKVSNKAITRRQINTQGRKGSGTRSLLNVRQIIAEAKREPDACPHVPSPQPPIMLYGVSLDDVEAMALASVEGQTDSLGRKLRDDTPILLAGVASYPRDEQYNDPDRFESWLEDTLLWLKNEYGDALKNITMHTDEEHPHIHFFAVSPDGRAKSLHAGYVAEQQLESKDRNDRRMAYCDAMRDFQDRYYVDVASQYGMLRLGPRKQRKSRAEYKAEKANAARLAEIMKTADQMENDATLQKESILATAKKQVTQMFSAAHEEIARLKAEALEWARNSIENLRKLRETEAKAEDLERKLSSTQDQLNHLAEENRSLKKKIEGFQNSPSE